MNNPFANDFFSGGFALAALATVVALIRRYAGVLLRTVLVDVDVRGWDEVMWLGLWLSHTQYGKRCRKLATRTIEREGVDAFARSYHDFIDALDKRKEEITG